MYLQNVYFELHYKYLHKKNTGYNAVTSMLEILYIHIHFYTDEKARRRASKLIIGDHAAIELLDWFVNEEMLKLPKQSFNSVSKDWMSRLNRKARECGGTSLQLYNFLKSKRKYFTDFLRVTEKSGAGEYN